MQHVMDEIECGYCGQVLGWVPPAGMRTTLFTHCWDKHRAPAKYTVRPKVVPPADWQSMDDHLRIVVLA